MACIRWVFPSPTPPYIKSGLYDFAGASATASEAACAKRLLFPITKVLKVYLGFSMLKLSFISDSAGSGLSMYLSASLVRTKFM